MKTIADIDKNVLAAFRKGVVIPAQPLALDENRQFMPKNQRALCRYYIDAGELKYIDFSLYASPDIITYLLGHKAPPAFFRPPDIKQSRYCRNHEQQCHDSRRDRYIQPCARSALRLPHSGFPRSFFLFHLCLV